VRVLAAGVAGFVAARSAPAARAAEGAPEHAATSLSSYEEQSIREALARTHAAIEDDPDGKILEQIQIVPLDVLEPRDVPPLRFAWKFLNWFHVTTQPSVIEREVLVRVGAPWNQALVDETARNLRGLPQLSMVLCVPVRGSRPDRVRLLVVTKDVWSLRLNSDWRIAGGRLERLALQPTEENLFGSHQQIAGQFTIDLASYSLGAHYAIPRIDSSFFGLSTDANVIINRTTGKTEGSFGGFSYGQPLYSTLAEWAWTASIGWRNEVTRRFCTPGGSVPCVGDGVIAGYDSTVTPEHELIPWQYRSDIVSGAEGITRSFGSLDKNDFTLALEVDRERYSTYDLSNIPAAASRDFLQTVVPVSDTRIGPTVEWHAYSTRYLRVKDLNTLGLQEDYRIGHEVYVKLVPVTRALGSSRDYVATRASVAYTWPLGDGLARVFGESSTELATDGTVPDAAVDAGLRLVTPTFVVGRLVFDGWFFDRFRDYLNQRSTLGGDTRLRGYPTQAFVGRDVVSWNLELRSRPLEFWSLELGAAAFWDAGDAFDGFADFQPKQSAGLGLRVLFPQLDRVVMRADWGVPLTPGYYRGGFPGDIIVTFSQAFSMPSVPTIW
jgi:hypothetical protein